jgi:hypothetical protein
VNLTLQRSHQINAPEIKQMLDPMESMQDRCYCLDDEKGATKDESRLIDMTTWRKNGPRLLTRAAELRSTT